MRSHAKASTAGSTKRRAKGLGNVGIARTAILAAAIAALLALSATSASASLLRSHESSFATFAAEDPHAIAVDQSNGDIYAISIADNSVYRFNSAGLPKNFTAGPDAGTNKLTGLNFQSFQSLDQVAVDNSGGPSDGNVYVTQSGSGEVKVFASSGEPLGSLNGSGTAGGSLGEVCGVAVDQSNGDLYLASFGNRIWRYSPSGATVVEGDYSGGIATSIEPCQLAVAPDSVYAHNWRESPTVGAGPVRKYATSDFALGSPPSPSSTQVADKAFAIAVDPSNGDLYVDEGDKISVYGSGGALKYSFGSGDFGTASAGVAVRAGGNAYVSDPSAHEVDVYGPFSAPPPIVETKVATGVQHVKATLNGHLDPNDSLPITGCVFEWGTDTSYAATPVDCAEGASFTQFADVSAELTGLTPGAIYHFRLHVTTGSGGFDGDDQSFEAAPASSTPEVVSGKGTIVSVTSSQVEGTVNPNGNPLTDCRFEYVDDLAIQASDFGDLSSGGSVPCDQAPGSISSDFEDHEVTATITGLDPKQVYRFRLVAENANGAGNGVDHVVPGPPLVETTGSPTRTATTARLDSRVSPHGADTIYHFQYVADAEFQANGFANAMSTPDTPFEVNEIQGVEVLGNPGSRFRLSFAGEATPELTKPVSADEVQAALRALPSIGSPDVRVTAEEDPAGASSVQAFVSVYTIFFEGALANTDVDRLLVLPGTPPIADSRAATRVQGGASERITFVSASLGALQPNTTYHYRVVADNGTPGGPTFGDGATMTTRVSDAPLGHGPFPGPPGSDRAWEQVSVPDMGGNGTGSTLAISDEGSRAVYSLSGGNPGSQVGSNYNQLFAERTASGWQSRLIYPTRNEAPGGSWQPPAGRSDLTRLFASNYDNTGLGTFDVWRLSPSAPAERVYGYPRVGSGVYTVVADDGSRVVARINGSYDPDHPVTATFPQDTNLYDITSGTPQLVSLLPDGSVPSCGTDQQQNSTSRSEHWLSPNGSRLFFLSGGNGICSVPQIYVRDFETETTSQVSSGSVAEFIRSTSDAAFFTTPSSLVPEDKGGKDVYRYDLADESLDCVTCFPGLTADVASNEGENVAIADDGSRLYFISPHRLLPGAADEGIYRVDVGDGDLVFVAPVNPGDWAGSRVHHGNAISADGSVFVFRSAAPGLDALNGPQNGGIAQYYRYDDDDRSLVCVSCPADGALPRGAVNEDISIGSEAGPNFGPLSAVGDLAFATPTALVSSDQNTARSGKTPNTGADIYEWRDGRLLLVTDGLTLSQGSGPVVASITPSGHDIFFDQAAQLTPDAIDAFRRLYDARIGGGFEFPTPPPPCPLDACQGTPKGTPEESRPGSLDFVGAGNQATALARCRKGKVRRSGRCVGRAHKRPKHHKRAQHRANHDRRASR